MRPVGLDPSIEVPIWEPTTAWERVIAGIERDGDVPLETALAAFSLTIGPLPGVPEPEGEISFIGSGSGPIRWILRHWDALSDEQQQAVRDHLAPRAASSGIVYAAAQAAPPGPRRTMPPSAGEEEVRRTVAQMVPELSRRLGRSLDVPVEVTFDFEGQDVWAATWPLGADGEPAASGKMSRCRMNWSRDHVLLEQNDLVAIAAHEVFHCFQYSLATIDEALRAAPWLTEGGAAWVGEEIGNGSFVVGQTYWYLWLTVPNVPLEGRAYDSIGFFAHAKEHDVDVWSLLDPMQMAAATSSVDAYLMLIGAANGEAIIDVWGSSFFRDQNLGKDWNMFGLGMPSQIPTPISEKAIGVDDVAYVLAQFHAGVAVGIDLTAPVFVIKAATPDTTDRGRIRFSDGTEHLVADVIGTPICTSPGGCACPPGTKGAGHMFMKGATGLTRLGLTGHPWVALVELAGFELERFCRDFSPADLVPSAPCLCPTIGFVPQAGRSRA